MAPFTPCFGFDIPLLSQLEVERVGREHWITSQGFQPQYLLSSIFGVKFLLHTYPLGISVAVTA